MQRFTLGLLLSVIFICSLVACEDAITINTDLGMLQTTEAASNKYERENVLLNIAYKELLAMLSTERQLTLKQSQRAWITFRDRTAEFEASEYKGGSLECLEMIESKVFLTQKRTEELVRFKLKAARP